MADTTPVDKDKGASTAELHDRAAADYRQNQADQAARNEPPKVG
ncbi:hypothetical protein ACWCQE_27735 [Streptomyces sp. NPDC002409]